MSESQQPDAETPKQGLRQRKKAQTHADIVEAATKAFLKHGFDNTTLEEIADAADVTKRTLLRYFPTKIDLVLWRQYDALESFRATVAAREEQSIVDIWEEHVAENAAWIAKHGIPGSDRSIASREPGIKSAYLSIQEQYQQLIYGRLIQEHGGGKKNEILFSVVAAALIGANYHVGSLYIGREDFKGLPGAERSVIELVKSGLLKDKPKKRK